MDHSAGSKTESLLMECSLVSHSKRSRVSCSYVSSIESNHTIHFCSKSMHDKIQCLSLILTGMSILEHVNMSTYLVSCPKEPPERKPAALAARPRDPGGRHRNARARARHDPLLADKRREVGKGLSLADTQTGR